MNQSKMPSGSVTQTITVTEPEPKSSGTNPDPTPSTPCTREQAERKTSRHSSSRKDSGSGSGSRKKDDSGLEQSFGRRRHGWDESTGFDEPEPEQTKEKETAKPIIGFSMIRSSSSSDKSQKKKSATAMAKNQRPPTRKEKLNYDAVGHGINPIEADLLDQEIERLEAERSANQSWNSSRRATEETGARAKSTTSNPGILLPTEKKVSTMSPPKPSQPPPTPTASNVEEDSIGND